MKVLFFYEMKTRAEVRFKGIVQGVHFRDYTRRFANQEKVTGWVRNLPDGSVQACFEGERHNIEEVVRRLREEHPRARIEKVEVQWGECRNEFPRFQIRS
jgi:acylphosphatase